MPIKAMQAKLFIAINIALLATLPPAHAGLQKGCKKVMQPYPDVVCRCGYRRTLHIRQTMKSTCKKVLFGSTLGPIKETKT